MEDCMFCKIVKGDVPSEKIWEDEKYLAFLDINPNTEGMSLVIPKNHYGSYIFDVPEEVMLGLTEAAKKVAKLLEKAFDINRVAVVAEGMGVDHLHIKLYPMHGVKGEFEVMEAKERVCFDNYQGYITTQMGPRADLEKLKATAKKIRA
jgi:histidine triad (HIT) family protein